jgi:hypothetical protein
VAGKKKAREGLRRVLYEEHLTRMNEERADAELAGWSEVQRKYRVELFVDGEFSARDKAKGRMGISAARVKRILQEGGNLSEAEVLRCRTRYFLDGLVIGSESFVNGVFAMARGYFGRKRRSGARRMRGVETTLYTIRELRRQAVIP